MKVICLQENLAKALNTVSRSVASRPQLPVLLNILLSTDEGRLKLSATNLETGVHNWVGAKIEKEGSFTVPARVFLEFVSSLPKDKVEISLEEQQLIVKSGGVEATFNGISSSEFPPLPSFPVETQLIFDSTSFSSAISKVFYAAATDEGRPILTGVLLRFLKNELSFAATDGFRLSLVKIANPAGGKSTSNKKTDDKDKEGETKIILSARTLLEVIRMVEENKEEKTGPSKNASDKNGLLFSLLPSGNQAMFSFSSTQIITQLIGGDFPAYEKIIPTSVTTSLIITQEELLKAVKIASIFARESANIIRFKIEEGKLTISANTPQVGTNKTTLGVKTEGEGGEIAFNSRYLLEFLNSTDSEEIVFEMTGGLNPGVFKPKNDPTYIHIIMPVRVQS